MMTWKDDELWEAVSRRDIAGARGALRKVMHPPCPASRWLLNSVYASMPGGGVQGAKVDYMLKETKGGCKSVLHQAAFMGHLPLFQFLVASACCQQAPAPARPAGMHGFVRVA